MADKYEGAYIKGGIGDSERPHGPKVSTKEMLANLQAGQPVAKSAAKPKAMLDSLMG